MNQLKVYDNTDSTDSVDWDDPLLILRGGLSVYDVEGELMIALEGGDALELPPRDLYEKLVDLLDDLYDQTEETKVGNV